LAVVSVGGYTVYHVVVVGLENVASVLGGAVPGTEFTIASVQLW